MPEKLIVLGLLGCMLITHASSVPDQDDQLVRELRREIRMLKIENETLRKCLRRDITPPILPPAERPSPSPWKCVVCGRSVKVEVKGTVRVSHVADSQDHPAKLSSADMKTLADGLRMRD